MIDPLAASGRVEGAARSSLSLLHAVVAAGAKDPTRTALVQQGGRSISYERLAEEASAVARLLSAPGGARRIAVAVPDGPHVVALFLGVSEVGTYIPLNPELATRDEFERMLRATRAELLLVADPESMACKAAHRLGVPFVFVVLDDAAAGVRIGAGRHAGPTVADRDPDAPALVVTTSGTTGLPKCVPLSIGNVLVSVGHAVDWMELGPGDRCLSPMPMFHCHGLLHTTMATLVSGGTVVVPRSRRPADIGDALHAFEPTWLSGSPAVLNAAVQGAGGPSTLRFVRSSSSPLTPVLQTSMERALDAPIVQGYGMTEACTQVTQNPLPPQARKASSVGLPAGPDVMVRTPDVEGAVAAPAGVVGEVLVRGPNVMRGYENDDAANERAFVDGWFRTGDLAYRDGDGYFFLVGRSKELINRGGEMLSPGEIEDVLRAIPGVTDAMAFGAPHPTLGEEVVAAVTLAAGATVSSLELCAEAGRALTNNRAPRRVLIVPELPRTPTGKLQRARGAALLGLGDRRDRVIASTAQAGIVAEVAAIWREVLGVDDVSPVEDFFLLGGDSLLATRVIAAVADALGVMIDPVRMFDDCSTVAGLASAIEQCDDTARIPTADEVLPSPMQEQLWFLDQLIADPSAYYVVTAFLVRGVVDAQRLDEAVKRVVARHDALRMRFPEDDGELRVVVAEEPRADMHVHDVADLSEAERVVAREARRPFDLVTGPLVRTIVCVTSDSQTIVAFVQHHIVTDRWSMDVFVREVGARYRGEDVAADAFRYADYAAWARSRVGDPSRERSLAYWKAQLAGLPSVMPGPSDLSANVVRRRLDADAWQRLVHTSASRGGTSFVALLALFAAAWHRVFGDTDIAIATASAGRNRSELADAIGCYVNTFVVRAQVDAPTAVTDVIDDVRRTVVEALRHDVPFADVVRATAPPRDAGRNPLASVFVHEARLGHAVLDLGPSTSSYRVDPTTSHFDVHFELVTGDGCVDVRVLHRTAVHDSAVVERLVDAMEQLLDEGGDAVQDVPGSGANITWMSASNVARSVPDPEIGAVGVDRARLEQEFAERWPNLAPALWLDRPGADDVEHEMRQRYNEFDSDADGRGDSYRSAQTDVLVRWTGIAALLDLAGARGQSAPIRLLDVLGGDGLVARATRAMGDHVATASILTADISRQMVGAARRHGLPAIRQPASFMLLRDGSFDAVVFAYGTHHVAPEDRLDAFVEARRVLRPGGRVVLHDFDESGAMARWFREVVHRHAQGGHDHVHFTPEDMRDGLEAVGFVDVRVTELYDPLITSGSTPPSALAELVDYVIAMYGLRFPNGWSVDERRAETERLLREVVRYDGTDAARCPEITVYAGSEGWRAELPRVSLVASGTVPAG